MWALHVESAGQTKSMSHVSENRSLNHRGSQITLVLIVERSKCPKYLVEGYELD